MGKRDEWSMQHLTHGVSTVAERLGKSLALPRSQVLREFGRAHQLSRRRNFRLFVVQVESDFWLTDWAP
jgi:hypothetical protein